MYESKITGKILKELRLKKKKTQEKVAEEVGINIKTYQAIESGSRGGRIDSLCILANYFEVSLDYLVYGKCSMHIEVLSKLEKQDENKRMKILNIMEDIMELL